MKLTAKAVAGLTLPLGKTELIMFDDSLAGFGLRLRAGGKRTWIVQYRVGQKQRRLTLGTTATLTADDARTLARSKLAMAQLGDDPQLRKARVRSAAAVTFDKLAGSYLGGYASTRLGPGTLADVRRYLERDLKVLASLPVSGVSRADVSAALDEVAVKSGPYSANRARAALSSLFSWALASGLAETNPVLGTRRAIDERPRERVLTDDELALIWRNADGSDYGIILRLLILTGQRREEVGGMAWTEINLDTGVWRIPGARSKNSRPHDVPLGEVALGLLTGKERIVGRDLVFGLKGPFSGWSKAKKALDQRMIVDPRVANSLPAQSLSEAIDVDPWRLHDLRRTVVTRMADLGVLPHVVEALVNHVSGHKAGVAGVYNRSTYAKEKAAAVGMWEDHLKDVVIK